MNKEKYINYRNQKHYLRIIYFYFIDNYNLDIDYNTFQKTFHTYLINMVQQYYTETQTLVSENQIINDLLSIIIPFYDKKYQIIEITVEKKVVSIQKIKYFI